MVPNRTDAHVGCRVRDSDSWRQMLEGPLFFISQLLGGTSALEFCGAKTRAWEANVMH